MRTLTVVLWVSSGILAAQHQQTDDGKRRNPAIGNLAAIAAGEKAFNEGCAVCHGQGGTGGRGPNLANGRVMWHSLTDEATFRRIKDGVPSGGMPPTPGSDEKLWQLTAYVVALRAPAARRARSPCSARRNCGCCSAVSARCSKGGSRRWPVILKSGWKTMRRTGR